MSDVRYVTVSVLEETRERLKKGFKPLEGWDERINRAIDAEDYLVKLRRKYPEMFQEEVAVTA